MRHYVTGGRYDPIARQARSDLTRRGICVLPGVLRSLSR